MISKTSLHISNQEFAKKREQEAIIPRAATTGPVVEHAKLGQRIGPKARVASRVVVVAAALPVAARTGPLVAPAARRVPERRAVGDGAVAEGRLAAVAAIALVAAAESDGNGQRGAKSRREDGARLTPCCCNMARFRQ